MVDAGPPCLRGKTLLIVEDEYMVAVEMARTLEDLGVEVIGPAGSLKDALRLVEKEGERLDGAALDINLRDELVYPVADALSSRGVPFIFATGYDVSAIPHRYAGVPRCEKPVDKALLTGLLLSLYGAGSSHTAEG